MSTKRRVLLPLVVLAYAALVRPRIRRWGATPDEANGVYPGDDLVPDGVQSTMAVTLSGPPEEVWSWLVQMGHDRAGWYSWDHLDNGGKPSSQHIIPEWQEIAVGDHLESLPDGKAYFTVKLLEPARTLVLGSELTFGRAAALEGLLPPVSSVGIWAFHLRPLPGERTRLIVRTRGEGHPRPLAWLLDFAFGQPTHFLMQVRQFQNLEARVGRLQSIEPFQRVG
jgi:proline iminopeptidase